MTACIVIAYIWSLSYCLLKRTTRGGNDKESTQLYYPVYPVSTTGTAAVTKGTLSWIYISFTCDNSMKDISTMTHKCCTEASQLPIYWHTDISLCLHWFQKYLWQCMACSLMGHHAEVHYQCKSSSHHWAALWQGYKCSPDEWQHRRMTQNNSRSKARMSSVTCHPPSSTFFSNISCLMPWKSMIRRLA